MCKLMADNTGRLLVTLMLGMSFALVGCQRQAAQRQPPTQQQPATAPTDAQGLPLAPLPDRDPALAHTLVEKHGALVIDVRTQAEFATGHVDGATLLPHDEMAARIDEVVKLAGGDRDKPIVLYCRSGGRAGKAKQVLIDQGFTRVTNMGGYSDW